MAPSHYHQGWARKPEIRELKTAHGKVDSWCCSMCKRRSWMAEAPEHLARMMVRTGGRVYFVRIADVDWIEAAGNYVRLHTGRESHVIRDSLSALETKLDPAAFARIHRSTMVNLERVKMLEPLFHGDYTVVLRDGTRLTLSRFYRESVESKLGGRL